MEKIKLFIVSEKGKDILTVSIVILVGLASFGLGRLSVKDSNAGIKIEYPTPLASLDTSQEANALSAIKTTSNVPKISKTITQATSFAGKVYFASSRGSKYYSIGCSGGKTLKEENKIYFSTPAEAEAAGYELSSTCK